MGKLIDLNRNDNYEINNIQKLNDIAEVTGELLQEVRTDVKSKSLYAVPISELSLLGAGISSLIPELRTITQTTTVNMGEYYKLVNANPGDVLKVAKNGNSWGALKTSAGASKMAQFQQAGSLTATSTAVMPIDPAMILIAVALYSVEKRVKSIENIQKQILSFQEIERESEIEADVETLFSIVNSYKYDWDNEHFVTSNHNLVINIQNKARKNMLSFKKQVATILDSRKIIVGQSKVEAILKDLQKKFIYYRMSLYTFSMATFVEILLSENYKEESIRHKKEENEKIALEYREIFSNCSMYLEKMAAASLEANVLKGIGTATKTVGNIIGNIPLVKEGVVDEFLQDSGEHIKENGKGLQNSIIESFAILHNPGTGIFLEKMEDLIQIYNHTSQICVDDQKIYLLVG